MKIITISLLLMFISTTTNAQVTITDYDTCQYLQQYDGEWRYTNGNDTIRIYLRYHRTANTTYYSTTTTTITDRLWGWHEYKRGNIVIESNYQNRLLALPSENDFNPMFSSILLGLPNCADTSKRLIGFITDYLQQKEWHVVRASLDATKTIMTWHQERGTSLNDPFAGMGMTLPANFILIKQ